MEAWWKLAVPPVQSQTLLLEASARCHQAFTSHSGGAMSSRHVSSWWKVAQAALSLPGRRTLLKGFVEAEIPSPKLHLSSST